MLLLLNLISQLSYIVFNCLYSIYLTLIYICIHHLVIDVNSCVLYRLRDLLQTLVCQAKFRFVRSFLGLNALSLAILHLQIVKQGSNLGSKVRNLKPAVS